jgi:hypothetical protein
MLAIQHCKLILRGLNAQYVILGIGALYLVACMTPHDKSGPLAHGVRADAPRDSIGVMLSWTPEQTIVNFRRSDQIFAAHAIHHGANVSGRTGNR